MVIDWEAVASCCVCNVCDIPKDLIEIFEALDERIKEANAMTFEPRENFGLRSTQIIGLVVLLWKMGILKGV